MQRLAMSATHSPTDSHTHRRPDIDELDRSIVKLAARINAANYELLVLVRRFDERGGWLKWGFPNCSEWLHWRCDLSLSAARERVRVAHALKTLPAIASAFPHGELSYSKVRALTRVARTDNEEALKTFALKTTAARVEERCRELRCGTADSISDANRAHANRSLRIHRDPTGGTMTITVKLPPRALSLLRRPGQHSKPMRWCRWPMPIWRGKVEHRPVLQSTTRSQCMWIVRR